LCERVIIINRGNIVADDSLVNLQKANAGQQQVIVSFKENISVDELAVIKDVTEVKQLSTFSFQFSTNNADVVKKQILQLSIDKNLNILSLQSGEQSLEEVFRELTGVN